VTELLTIDETAALLKLSDWTVHPMGRGGRVAGATTQAGKRRIGHQKLLARVDQGGEHGIGSTAKDEGAR